VGYKAYRKVTVENIEESALKRQLAPLGQPLARKLVGAG
jgi:hypothetical protein